MQPKFKVSIWVALLYKNRAGNLRRTFMNTTIDIFADDIRKAYDAAEDFIDANFVNVEEWKIKSITQ